MLENYIHPKKKTRVKKVLTIVTNGILEKNESGIERIGEFCDFGSKGTKGQFKHSKGHKGQILYYNEKNTIKVMPVFSNQKTQEAKDKLIQTGCKPYLRGQIFYSGILVEIPNDFQGGKNTYSKGIYKLRTITTAGQIKLEDNNGNEILTSASNLVEKGFKKANIDF